MSEQAKLNDEELEKVTGGFHQIDVDCTTAKCPLCGRPVEVDRLPISCKCPECGKDAYFTERYSW